MADWDTVKGVTITDATPTGAGGGYLNANFTTLRDEAPYNSASDPGSGDDSTEGFFVGSQWFNTSTQVMWACTDATSAAAVWKTLYMRTSGALVLCPGGDGSVQTGNLQLSGNTLSATNTNGAVILSPNGSGAIQADSGGIARGSHAVDLQNSRSVGTQVASGAYAFVGGGKYNTASGKYSSIVGGKNNVVSQPYSFIGTGYSNATYGFYQAFIGTGSHNVINAPYGVIGGGFYNKMDVGFSAVGGGWNNSITNAYPNVAGQSYGCVIVGGWRNSIVISSASGGYASIGGGYNNSITTDFATISGGRSNTASGFYSFIGSGNEALADKCGQQAHAVGMFSTPGDAQRSDFVSRTSTPNATPKVMFLNGSSERMTIASNSTWAFSILITARSSADSSVWKIEGCIANNGGTVALVGTASPTLIQQSAGASSWSIAATADNTNKALVLTATGATSTTIQWVAHTRTVETIL